MNEVNMDIGFFFFGVLIAWMYETFYLISTPYGYTTELDNCLLVTFVHAVFTCLSVWR